MTESVVNFPSQAVSDLEKLSEEYGLKVAKAIKQEWFTGTTSKFDITKRTKHDASISSGLAIMACNRHLYKPNPDRNKTPLNLMISKYNNKGISSRIIKQKT